MITINEALKAQKLQIPIIAKWPFTDEIEYTRILEINMDRKTVLLQDKCKNSFTIASMKNLKIKNI